MLLLRRRFLCTSLLVALAACTSVPPAPVEPAKAAEPVAPARATPARDVRFVVLHVNDVHGQVLTRKATWIDKQNPPQVGGLARAAGYVNQVREEARREGFELLVLDAGDWYQGTPEGIVANGLEFVTAFAKLGFDAMCVGNHEFDRGVPNVLRLLTMGGVPAICANLRPKGEPQRVDWVPPYRIVEKGGVRIALVGLLTQVTPEITHKDALTLDFGEPRAELARVARELEGKVDWLLPVTHLGVETDKELARAFPELPLVVGGHSHTLLKEGARVGDTLIVQTGTKLSCVGRVELVAHVPASDAKDRRVTFTDVHARLVDLLEEPKDEFRNREVEQRCAALAEHTQKTMDEVVGALSVGVTRSKDPLVSGPAGNLLADVMRERAGADVGLMNRGGVRADIDAGPVTRREVFEIMPFDNALVSVSMKGAQLQELVRRAVEGVAHSGIEVSGLVVQVKVDAEKKRTLTGLLVGGAPLDPQKVYRVAMNSFMADGGDAYLEKGGEVARQETGVLIREVLEDALEAAKTLAPKAENRYEVVKP
ncbi:MAG: bifunctional metallophosphatase/5'-nucleotidase [Planctomycetes bacterium]|nr:bifunctional metallophosphatase/5'-nucleotidase [Planctomycetota bacterium]